MMYYHCHEYCRITLTTATSRRTLASSCPGKDGGRGGGTSELAGQLKQEARVRVIAGTAAGAGHSPADILGTPPLLEGRHRPAGRGRLPAQATKTCESSRRAKEGRAQKTPAKRRMHRGSPEGGRGGGGRLGGPGRVPAVDAPAAGTLAAAGTPPLLVGRQHPAGWRTLPAFAKLFAVRSARLERLKPSGRCLLWISVLLRGIRRLRIARLHRMRCGRLCGIRRVPNVSAWCRRRLSDLALHVRLDLGDLTGLNVRATELRIPGTDSPVLLDISRIRASAQHEARCLGARVVAHSVCQSLCDSAFFSGVLYRLFMYLRRNALARSLAAVRRRTGGAQSAAASPLPRRVDGLKKNRYSPK